MNNFECAKGKRVLLIGGGGTLGTYVSEELLRLGCEVDVICPEEKVSANAKLRFIRDYVSEELLQDLFAKAHYDGIVNFIHSREVEDFKRSYDLLIKNTDHLIVLSSYRVYANEQHPITETAPRLHDVYTDEDLLTYDKYGVSKGLCEDFLTGERKGQSWTIVRPVISFSQYRLDIVMNSGKEVLECAQEGKPMLLPLSVKNYRAGLDWAGNSGKLIANLLFKKNAIGEAFTVYSGHNMTWGEIAEAYTAEVGVEFKWVSDEEYIETKPAIKTNGNAKWMWKYDRVFNRDIDNSKILAVTGLKREDFTSVREGIRIEVDKINKN